MTKIKLKCKCGYKWIYKGKSRFYEIALSSAAENYLPSEILRFFRPMSL